MKKFILTTLLFSLLVCFAFAEPIYLKSPDGLISLSFDLNNGKPTYALNYKGKPVLEPSILGFKLKDMNDFGNNFLLEKAENKSVNETWNPAWGEVKTIRNQYNELIVTLKDNAPKAHVITLTFRLFNDGLGFRYTFPEQENLQHFIVENELTSFNLNDDHKIWWIPGDFDTNEYAYYTSKISEIASMAKKRDGAIFTATPIEGAFVQTPLMAKTKDGVYLNIHEAALVNYPCMDIKFDVNSFEGTTTLAPDAVGNKAYLRTPFRHQ